MIPNIKILSQEITKTVYPDKTYKIVYQSTPMSNGIMRMTLSGETESNDRIEGYTEGLDAIAQAAYLILSTERYKQIIYSWDYGVELVDLIGKPMPYVTSELPRRITEALTQDNRIDDVINFEFSHNRNRLNVSFTIVSNVGNVSADLEVSI